ncbi:MULTISPECIES: AAA family ATPase [Thioalkalivibrio]|uniref:AAA family ATPase n=1 Tax=Thioalkalivibrio halophilus TaxID=252474 RepID=A0A1V2ZZQ8_9GAMM|nr:MULTISPECIES: MoxR family ATPase [Thioalkalivibrio]OOC10598.1 AAA family ATPase [Thioalkalivibrio halophilus]PYG00412.1 MoxR-like ATPase [Thioalkalivibrio sp. ALE21]
MSSGTDALQRVEQALNQILLGKPRAIRLALTCLLANGHLLIEDLPGVGKTTLAHALARAMNLDYRRVQFTSDLLPGDVLGVSVFEQGSGEFRFHPGPIFTQVLLADEVNRAPPKTQSALLEAMEERQASVEGATRDLPEPFFVIATQNPEEQVGTHPLPESQLDRFLMRIELGYPDPRAERALLERRGDTGHPAPDTMATPEQLAEWQASVDAVHADSKVLDYLQELVAASRDTARFAHGLSPRAGVGLLRAARAHAFLDTRDYITPDDIARVLPAVAGHRVRAREPQDSARTVEALLECVPSR